ncbi:hypothetical protein M422DRAFT_257914 [Sphaerobolus stellatus SS14]|uniref:Uncharacterized protein n=1 Tax=Sphaerobolus stellatus (strain SS14) TaxID=990650 RepID=A0A0C9U8E1_SPHS4|nr:hypothetical protein M422DRAFT_257914 [Sphaerobolus stellatus SS14]
MDPLHINSPLTSECESESEQGSTNGAGETVALLYEHPNYIDIPNYFWDKTSPPCSLWEHTLAHHGRPNTDGSITLHKWCLGCSKAAFEKHTIKNPQCLFTEVKVLDKIQIICNMLDAIDNVLGFFCAENQWLTQ